MSEVLSDVNQFDASIQMPSAGENISAADLRDKAIQRLANRTYYNKLRVDTNTSNIAALEANVIKRTQFVTGFFDTDAKGHNSQFKTIYQFATSGEGSWVHGGTGLTWGMPIVGKYLVTADLVLRSDDATDNTPVGISIGVGATNVTFRTSRRHSTSTLHEVPLSIVAVVDVADTAVDLISFRAQCAGGGNLSVPSTTSGNYKIELLRPNIV